MNNNVKLLAGVALVIGGIVAYNKTDNKTILKANDDVSGKVLAAGVIALGVYVMYKAK